MEPNVKDYFYLITPQGKFLRRIHTVTGGTFEWYWGWANCNELTSNPDKKSKVKFILDQSEERKKFRVDIRRSKRGTIIESFWTNSFDAKTRAGYYINVYQRFGKRMFRVCHYDPTKTDLEKL